VRYGFGLAGIGALAFFVYGGFTFITSAGKPEKITQGRSIMINTIIGLLIMVFAWSGINFILTTFTGSKPNTDYVIKGLSSDRTWYNICKIKDDTACTNQTGWSCQDLPATDYAGNTINNSQECGTTKGYCKKSLCTGNSNRVCVKTQ